MIEENIPGSEYVNVPANKKKKKRKKNVCSRNANSEIRGSCYLLAPGT
jgi:hypothetical protein